MKTCSRCESQREESEFSKLVSARDGLHSWCKPCTRAYGKALYHKDPEGYNRRSAICRKNNPSGWRSWYLRTTYGISLTQYDTLLMGQGGKCAVCSTQDPGGYKYLVVDHDHASDKIRGLLCNGCNTGSKLTDNPDLLVRKILYLLKHGKVLSSELLTQLRETA